MVKIIGGQAKGHQLRVREGLRPTSFMLRKKLFDAWQTWDSWSFVDLCAGCGGMGFEAWSRGARSVTLIEHDKKTFLSLKKNRDYFARHFEKELSKRPLETVYSKAETWLSTCPMEEKTALYLDPPYSFINVYLRTLGLLRELNFKGVLWIESDRFKGISREKILEFFDIFKTYKHSNGYLYKIIC